MNFFKEVLFRPNTKLVIIGYGFRDKHINEIIKEAIEECKLKLIVISTESPKQFVNKLRGLSGEYPFGDTIINKGLIGYRSMELKEGSILTIANDLFLRK